MLKILKYGQEKEIFEKEKEIVGAIYEKKCKRQIKQSLDLKELIKKKGNKLYVKWTGSKNWFSSWID